MMSLAFMLGLLALLFVMGYSTRRRFGILGLALAAGSLLSLHFADTITPFIQQQGVILVAPPLQAVVQATLVILPPLILLFSGPSYHGAWSRIAGAAGFALLGLIFLLPPLKIALALDGPGKVFFDALSNYASLIIVIGMIGAIIDTLLTGKPRHRRGEH